MGPVARKSPSTIVTLGGADSRSSRARSRSISYAATDRAEIRLYEYLFMKPDPDDAEPGENYLANLNPDSLRVVSGLVEPSIAVADRRDHLVGRDRAHPAAFRGQRLGALTPQLDELLGPQPPSA